MKIIAGLTHQSSLSNGTSINFTGVEALKLSDIEKAIKILDKVTPIAHSVLQNLSDEKMEIFKEQFKPIEYPTIQTQIFGIPVYEKSFVPLDEFWFVDKEGKVLKKFKL